MKILQCACILGAVAALYSVAQRATVREPSLASGETLALAVLDNARLYWRARHPARQAPASRRRRAKAHAPARAVPPNKVQQRRQKHRHYMQHFHCANRPPTVDTGPKQVN